MGPGLAAQCHVESREAERRGGQSWEGGRTRSRSFLRTPARLETRERVFCRDRSPLIDMPIRGATGKAQAIVTDASYHPNCPHLFQSRDTIAIVTIYWKQGYSLHGKPFRVLRRLTSISPLMIAQPFRDQPLRLYRFG
jgi:hypothetical protein